MAKYLVIGQMGSIMDEAESFDKAFRIAEARAKNNLYAPYIIAKVQGTIKAEKLPSPVVVHYEEDK